MGKKSNVNIAAKSMTELSRIRQMNRDLLDELDKTDEFRFSFGIFTAVIRKNKSGSGWLWRVMVIYPDQSRKALTHPNRKRTIALSRKSSSVWDAVEGASFFLTRISGSAEAVRFSLARKFRT